MAGDSHAFITRLDAPAGSALRLAVKDLIDVAGVITTAGSRLVAAGAQPAAEDARCLAGARAAGAAIIGKANLQELALGGTGLNPWFGNPRNPRAATLIPGGSSSGSAVAVGDGEADVAFGTDTGGSIRTPAACCGIAGLKTTHGRIPLAGVWPLAPSLDTVGPMARDIAGLVTGMQLLEPGFEADAQPPARIGRLVLPADPGTDRDVDRALTAAGFKLDRCPAGVWAHAWSTAVTVLEAEAAIANAALLDDLDRIDPQVAPRLVRGRSVEPSVLATAYRFAGRWRGDLLAMLDRNPVLACATLTRDPPTIARAEGVVMNRNLAPVNLAGLPAVSFPVGTRRPVPASLQLIGAPGSEELLLATALRIESGARIRR